VPIIPKITAKILPWCNLRQALQWLTDEIKPVAPAVEEALRIPRTIYVRGLENEISALFAVFIGGRIRLFGCPGEGKACTSQLDNPSIYFEHYGECRQISIQEIADAGISGFDFDCNRLCKITEETDWGALPLDGWEYINVVMLTEELLTTFPSVTGGHDRSFEPAPIDLAGAQDMRSGGPLSSLAETSAEAAPIAQTHVFSLSGNRIVPGPMFAGGNREDAKTNLVALPPYLRFAVWSFRKLGPDEIASRKKSDLEAEIKKRWSAHRPIRSSST
jgi:hypothetical protein